MQPEKASEQRLSAEVPFCCPGCWHCCCGFIVTLTCVCPLPQWRNRYQQNFGEIIDLNPYSKKKGFFSLQIQDNASWNTQKESMRNTSIRARMTHNINSFHNWRHLNKIWDNTIQPGEGQPVCEGVRFSDSLAVNICRLFHTAQWHMSEKATLTGLRWRPRRRREKQEKTDKLHLSVRVWWKQTHTVLRQVTSWQHQLNPWF